MNRFAVFVLLAAVALAPGACGQGQPLTLSSIGAIDAHAHVYSADPQVVRFFEKLNLRIVNICVIDPKDRGFEQAEPQHTAAKALYRATGGRAAWVSTFDAEGWEKPGFAKAAIAQLDQTFRDGAIGVKIYKTIGLDIRSKSGQYLMPDNPVFDPIMEAIAARGKTLYAHLAEPAIAWKPLDPSDPDSSYYESNPYWHVFHRPGVPAKEQILAARDRLVARHPRLRVIGCHLGSMEEDIADIAQRLEKYPNFAVDMAARVVHLSRQDREKVRRVILKYPDRFLYATDFVLMTWNDAGKSLRNWQAELERDWKFLATAETVEMQGRKVQGLALPGDVLKKIYRENALHWAPGIVNTK